MGSVTVIVEEVMSRSDWFIIGSLIHVAGLIRPGKLQRFKSRGSKIGDWKCLSTVVVYVNRWLFITRGNAYMTVLIRRHIVDIPWWRHQMETLSALLAICAGNSPAPGEFPPQRPVTRGFHVFFDLHPNKRLSKQSWGWWFETPSRPLWRHCNAALWFQLHHSVPMLMITSLEARRNTHDKFAIVKCQGIFFWKDAVGVWGIVKYYRMSYHMMTSSNGNIFRVTGHLCGKFTGPRWISRTKASYAELWCFLWFTPE